MGSSLGGTILPIVVRKLLPAVGFKWTIRTLAFIIAALCLFFNLTVRPRIPIKKTNAGLPIRALLSHGALMVSRHSALATSF